MTNSIKISVVPIELVNQFLPLVQEHVEVALVFTDLSFDQAKVFISNGSWYLLIATDEEAKTMNGAYTLAISNNPNDRVATIVTAGGAGLASQSCFNQVCEIAKSFGATKIQALARESAARLYQRVGLVDKAILMEKKL